MFLYNLRDARDMSHMAAEMRSFQLPQVLKLWCLWQTLHTAPTHQIMIPNTRTSLESPCLIHETQTRQVKELFTQSKQSFKLLLFKEYRQQCYYSYTSRENPSASALTSFMTARSNANSEINQDSGFLKLRSSTGHEPSLKLRKTCRRATSDHLQ